MKKIYFGLSLIFLFIQLNAQTIDTLNQDVSPKGGINALAIKYLGIEFSKEQRRKLKDIEIEFIFQVDEKGKANLEEVNGISDQDIIDSLVNKTAEVPNFNPSIRNGKASASIYFMKLIFPNYKMSERQFGMLYAQRYNEAKIEDFEYIHKTNERLDLLFGGMANQFIGNASKHLAFGGGMKMDVNYTGKRHFIFGMNMNAYFNKLKKEFNINSIRSQHESPTTALIGVHFGKWFNKYNIQFDLALASQNITEKLGDDDKDWIQFKGWSPGLVVNYPIKIGKEKTYYYYGSPSIFNHFINLHLGLRKIFLSNKEANGGMIELGLCYRMTVFKIDKYKLKE